MKNIPLTADERLNEAAGQRAWAQPSTLTAECRPWPAHDASSDETMQHHEAVMATLRGRLRVGRKLSRDEMNER